MNKLTREPVSDFRRGGLLLGLSLLTALFIILAPGILDPPPGAIVLPSSMKASLDGAAPEIVPVPTLFSSSKDPRYRPGMYSFEFELEKPLEASGGDIPNGLVLVFPHISGNSLSVSLNGNGIGSRGDPASGRSTIWNSAHIFPLPKGNLRDGTIVMAEINGTYEAGIIAQPYMIDAERHGLSLFVLMMLTNYVIWILFGAIMAVSLIVLCMGFFETSGPSAGSYLGLAGIMVAILILDFAYVERLPISIVAFKKIVVSCRHIASILFILAYFRLLGRKPGMAGKAICALQAACAFLVLIFPGTIVDIKRLYGYTYLSFIPFQAYLLFIVFRYTRRLHAFDALTFGVLVAIFSSLRDIAYLVLVPGSGAFMVSHYGFVVLAFSASAYVVRDAFLHYNDLANEKKRAAFFRNESRIDALTGCYNRKVIPALEESLGEPFALLIFDIDDLKNVNDTHGHLAGDAILVDAARIAARDIRVSDLVIRIGGDEFMLALKECPESTAKSVAERIVKDCASSTIHTESGAEIHYTISLGLANCCSASAPELTNLQQTMEAADALLYKAKKAGKGRWCAG